MLFFSEPLWALQRRGITPKRIFALPDVSLDVKTSRGVEGCQNSERRELGYRRGSKWAGPSAFALQFQSLCAYAFLSVVIVNYTALRDQHGLTNTVMTAVIAISIMAHYFTSKMWNLTESSVLSVRTIVVVASGLSTLMTVVYLVKPVTIAFTSMVIFKGLLYGFIMGPTSTMVGHLYQRNTVVGLHKMYVSYMYFCTTMPVAYHGLGLICGLRVVLYTLCAVDVISCIFNLLFLSRTVVARKEVTQEEMNHIMTLASNSQSEAARQTVQEQESEERTPLKNVAEVEDIREQNRLLLDRLSLFANTQHSTESCVNPETTLRQEPEQMCCIRKWAQLKHIMVFRLPSDESWITGSSQLRCAVLGQSLLQTSLIAYVFFTALCIERKIDDEESILLLGCLILGWVVAKFLSFFLLHVAHLINYRTVIWPTAIGAGFLLWNCERFTDFSSMRWFAFGTGFLAMMSIGASVDYILECQDNGNLASAFGAKTFIGTLVFSFVLVVHGAYLDHTGDVFEVYKLLGGFLALCSIPILFSWLKDKCSFLLHLFLCAIPQCCRFGCCEQNEKQNLRSFYEPI